MKELLDLVRPAIRELSAYSVPMPEGIKVKLDANEHPYALPEDVVEALGRGLERVSLHRYPRADGAPLRQTIAKEHGLSPAQIVLGNGSDELIQLICTTFARPRTGQKQAVVLFPTPTFSVFSIATSAIGARWVGVEMGLDFQVDATALEERIQQERPNVVFLARPNNPTGVHWHDDEFLQLVSSCPDVLFVSDEAYAGYGATSVIDSLDACENLLVLRTLSKIGLASLRVGYLAGAPQLCAEVDKVRSPYNVGSLNLFAAEFLLTQHKALLQARCDEVVKERSRVGESLLRAGLQPYPSEANFLLFRVPVEGRATTLWRHLCARGVLVRNLDSGLTQGCLRVTIGTPSENDSFMAALESFGG